jgi:hypothetical protein
VTTSRVCIRKLELPSLEEEGVRTLKGYHASTPLSDSYYVAFLTSSFRSFSPAKVIQYTFIQGAILM